MAGHASSNAGASSGSPVARAGEVSAAPTSEHRADPSRSPVSRSSGARRVRVKLLVRVTASLLLLIAIVWRVGAARLVSALQGVSPEWVLAALLLAVPRLGIKVLRWRILIAGATEMGWGTAVRSMLIGIAGGMVTPSRVGQVSAAFFIPGGDRLAIGAMAFADLVMDAAAAIVAAAPAAAYLWGGSVTTWALLATAAALAAVSAGPRVAGYLGRRVPTGFAHRVLAPLGSLRARRALWAFGLSVAVLGFNVVQLYLLVRAFQFAPFVAAAVSCPLVFVALGLPVTIAGFGVREVTAAALLGKFGVAPEAAVEASFLLFVMNVAVPALAGAVVLWHGRRVR
jgi:uncharacterized membrane protein YbhN (UPF0104 family)